MRTTRREREHTLPHDDGARLPLGKPVMIDFAGRDEAAVRGTLGDLMEDSLEVAISMALVPPTARVAGAIWLFRYMSQGTACCAAGAVMADVDGAAGRVRVTIPARVSAHTARVYRGGDADVLVDYGLLGEGGAIPQVMMNAKLQDVQPERCTMQTVEPLVPGDRVDLAFAMPPTCPPVMCRGTVQSGTREAGGHTVVLAFDPLSSTQTAAISDLMAVRKG